jgi:hypothetical protein
MRWKAAFAAQPFRDNLQHCIGHRAKLVEALVGVLANIELDLRQSVQPGEAPRVDSAAPSRRRNRSRTEAARAASGERRSLRRAADDSG